MESPFRPERIACAASGRCRVRYADLRRRRGAPVHAGRGAVGRRRHGGRRADRRAADLARAELRHPVAQLRAPAPAAHQRGDLRVRRLRAVGHQPTTSCSAPARCALFLPKLAAFMFWGWQAVIVAAAITLPLGYTQGKEYAELEWPIDLLIAVVWVAYAVVFFGTIGIRKVRHIYVANWFFGAFIITVALLHIVNSAAIPVELVEELLGLRRRAGRDGAVVVRPQRGRLLPDRGLPRDDVLLHPEAGRAAGLLVPAVDRALLGADLHLHVGGPAPPALHRAARLGAVGRHGVLAGAAGAELGRHDQRR